MLWFPLDEFLRFKPVNLLRTQRTTPGLGKDPSEGTRWGD